MLELQLCFIKQKTGYELRISDWSSDVCSSDLQAAVDPDGAILVKARLIAEGAEEELEALRFDDRFAGGVVDDEVREIGLAGPRAARGEFRRSETDAIKRAHDRMWHIIEAARLWSGRTESGSAECRSNGCNCLSIVVV